MTVVLKADFLVRPFLTLQQGEDIVRNQRNGRVGCCSRQEEKVLHHWSIKLSLDSASPAPLVKALECSFGCCWLRWVIGRTAAKQEEV